MEHTHFMALDVHCRFCHFVWASPGGKLHDWGQIPTAIPPLLEAIRRVPRPRTLVMEEGPMAAWLRLHLEPACDLLLVADPRRNHLISDDGDKDDPIDAAKLLELTRNKQVRIVHQSGSEGMMLLKQHVGLYHRCVRQRVQQANRVIWQLRRWGLVLKEADLADPRRRLKALAALPRRRTLRMDLDCMLAIYDTLAGQVQRLRGDIRRLGSKIPQVERFAQLPGIGHVRAVTLYAYLDTPWRFPTKQKLWKYLGIGLRRHKSGDGPERLGVPRRVNRLLKSTILGAAMSATAHGDNPFADAHRRYLRSDCAPRIARRSVARLMAAVLWGMWKSGGEYRPDWVGVPAAGLAGER